MTVNKDFLITEKDQLDFMEAKIRADERKKVLEEVREITKTIEAGDIVARAELCDENHYCYECDGCLTTLLFKQLEEKLND